MSDPAFAALLGFLLGYLVGVMLTAAKVADLGDRLERLAEELERLRRRL